MLKFCIILCLMLKLCPLFGGDFHTFNPRNLNLSQNTYKWYGINTSGKVNKNDFRRSLYELYQKNDSGTETTILYIDHKFGCIISRIIEAAKVQQKWIQIPQTLARVLENSDTRFIKLVDSPNTESALEIDGKFSKLIIQESTKFGFFGKKSGKSLSQTEFHIPLI